MFLEEKFAHECNVYILRSIFISSLLLYYGDWSFSYQVLSYWLVGLLQWVLSVIKIRIILLYKKLLLFSHFYCNFLENILENKNVLCIYIKNLLSIRRVRMIKLKLFYIYFNYCLVIFILTGEPFLQIRNKNKLQIFNLQNY